MLNSSKQPNVCFCILWCSVWLQLIPNTHTLPSCRTQLSLSLFLLGEEEPSHASGAAARLTPRDNPQINVRVPGGILTGQKPAGPGIPSGSEVVGEVGFMEKHKKRAGPAPRLPLFGRGAPRARARPRRRAQRGAGFSANKTCWLVF